MIELIANARVGDKFAIAKLVSLFESSRTVDQDACVAVENALAADGKCGRIVGLTGAPGAGKSTLIQHLVDALLDKESNWRFAIVAVDPSSPISGGAILGDRTRVNFGDNPRVYFRSQASDLDLGGIGRNTYRVCRLLQRFFDIVLVESVGVGQSEIEIARLADTTLLALQPFTGDQIQFMKSGIMEVPEAFVITKCDAEDLAQKSFHQLEASLHFMQRAEKREHKIQIFQTSSVLRTGFAALADFVRLAKPLSSFAAVERENYFLRKEIRYYFGEYGVKKIAALVAGDDERFFETKRLALLESLRKTVANA